MADATGYQYRLKAGQAGYGPWTTVAGAATRHRHRAHSSDARLATAMVVSDLLVLRANAWGRGGRVTVLLSPANGTVTTARLLIIVEASPSVGGR